MCQISPLEPRHRAEADPMVRVLGEDGGFNFLLFLPYLCRYTRTDRMELAYLVLLRYHLPT